MDMCDIKKTLTDRKNYLKSELSQMKTEKIGKRINTGRITEFEIRLLELEWLINKLS